MTSKNISSKQHSITKVIYRFLGGATLGIFIVLIPLSCGSSIDFNLIQICVTLMLVISCGLLSSIWGEKFIDKVTYALNSFTL